MRRLRRVGCPTMAASQVSARRACQRRGSSARPGSEHPRPRLQRHAPRRDFIEYRGIPRLPRGHKSPRGSRLAVCLERAPIRCEVARRAFGGASARETSRWIAIRHLIAPFGAHVGVSRPRCRWQLCGGGTLPRRHESLTSRPTRLSISCGFQGNYSSFCSGRSHIPTPIVSGFDFRPGPSPAVARPPGLTDHRPPAVAGSRPARAPGSAGRVARGLRQCSRGVAGAVAGSGKGELRPEVDVGHLRLGGLLVLAPVAGNARAARLAFELAIRPAGLLPGSRWPSPSIPWPRSIASEARVT